MTLRRGLAPVVAAALGLGGVLAPAHAQEGARPHGGMLRFPAVSKDRLAFVYAGKLWLAPRGGGLAIPAADPAGQVLKPRFSPDGQSVAFTANYDGNYDLYSVPVEGGNPTRATYHPGVDTLCGWAPDGKLLYSNNLYDGQPRYSKLLTVAPGGGSPTQLPVPYGEDAAISPDGRWLAYTPSSTNNRTWKRYRGGWAQDIWLFDLQTRAARKITDWEGTDTLPMWSGEKLYYLSDDGPEHRLNLWVYDTKSGKRQQVTHFADYDVKWPSIGPGAIVFQHGAELRLLDLATGQSKAVEIRIPGDQPSVRPLTVDASRYIEGWGISPSAKRVVVTGRGDIWTLPAKEGSPRNLTRTSGAHEKDAAWSPDGKWIAYVSDATGEWELYRISADGKGEAQQLTRDGAKYRSLRSWSPDGKRILFADNTGAHYLLDPETGKSVLVDKDPLGNGLDMSWSPDSRWIVYSKSEDVRAQSGLWIYSVESGKTRRVTAGQFADGNPVFDRKGDWLYFVSNRIFRSPIYDESLTTWVYTSTQTLVAVPLREDIASPYLAKTDEEPAAERKDDKPKTELAVEPVAIQLDPISGDWTGTVADTPVGELTVKFTLKLAADGAVTGTFEAVGVGAGTATGKYEAATKKLTLAASVGGMTVNFEGTVDGNRYTATATVNAMQVKLTATRAGAPTPTPPAPSGAGKPAGDTGKAVEVKIDFENFEERAIALPVTPGRFGSLGVNAQNQLLFVRQSTPNAAQPAGIKLFDINDARREEKMVAAGAGGFALTPDGKKLLVVLGSGASIQDAGPGAGEPVPTAGMRLTVDRRAEWKEILHEAWRTERDFFYDPTMHGLDWKAVLARYEAMLPDAASRADVGYIVSELISELNVGHAYYSEEGEPEPQTPVGSLGCDFALENGAYKIARIYRGGPWDTDAKGPLSQPGVKVKEGDYLLAINGVPLDPKQDAYAALVGLAGQAITLTVSSKPTLDKDAREVTVRALGNDLGLRYRAWVERNRAYVEKASGGKIGYIYVPDTGIQGQSELLRQLVGQMNKDALVIDDRWNGGGQIPTRFIELLNRPLTNLWARRDGADWLWPPDAHFGPKAMLINGLAGSGGDAFPYYFRQAGLGKLIGTRTWGGLVGLSGGPSLIDGASVTAPSFAFYEKDGTWGIEGHGVDPDIEVLDDPSKMQNGADPQLDAAVAQLLKELKDKPVVFPKRPAYPNRRGIGIDPKDK